MECSSLQDSSTASAQCSVALPAAMQVRRSGCRKLIKGSRHSMAAAAAMCCCGIQDDRLADFLTNICWLAGESPTFTPHAILAGSAAAWRVRPRGARARQGLVCDNAKA
jgi:hypothetical protein